MHSDSNGIYWSMVSKSSGNEGDPNQTVIHDVAGDAESKLGGEDEDSYN